MFHLFLFVDSLRLRFRRSMSLPRRSRSRTTVPKKKKNQQRKERKNRRNKKKTTYHERCPAPPKWPLYLSKKPRGIELTEKELPKKEKNQQQKERKNGRNKKKNNLPYKMSKWPNGRNL